MKFQVIPRDYVTTGHQIYKSTVLYVQPITLIEHKSF